MNEILKYFVKSLSSSSQSLKKKGMLIDKPWGLIDEDGAIQKLIFKRDNGLILAKNGIVSEGTWEYFPEAKALLIDRGVDKLLLKEQFIDDNVLILKKDGTENDFYALANENSLPDYNIPCYLNTLRCKEFKIKEFNLFSGDLIQIHQAINSSNSQALSGNYSELTDLSYNVRSIPNGRYLAKSKLRTFYVNENKILKVTINVLKELSDGKKIEIEDGDQYSPYNNITKKVTLNGKRITNERITDADNYTYVLKESVIICVLFPIIYELTNGYKITIEQKDYDSISKGDKIVNYNPSPLPDGSYRIVGRIFKTHFKNNEIVETKMWT